MPRLRPKSATLQTIPQVKLGELEKFNNVAENNNAEEEKSVSKEEVEIEKVGIRFKDIDKSLREQYSVPPKVNGIIITGVKNNSPAFDAGFKVGNVISQMSQVNIESAEQAKKIFTKAFEQNAEIILMQVFQNGFPRFIPFKLK